MTPLPLLVLDVDGVLTDGRLTFDGAGERAKTFFVQDGAALSLWRHVGGRFILLSGRSSPAVEARAAEIKPLAVLQGIDDKLPALRDFCRSIDLNLPDTAAVGDDWADLPLMHDCGYGIAVANAIPAVKRAAAHVTQRPGGGGGVADAVQHLLRRARQWENAIARYETRSIATAGA